MSQSKQALRARIKSVNSTKKITKAMEMIANAKLLKQRNRMEKNRTYAQRLQDTVNEIVAKNPRLDNVFLKGGKGDHRYAIVICSDLGLCGSYNANMLKYVRQNLSVNDDLVVVGTSLFQTLKNEGFKVIHDKPIAVDQADFATMKKLVEDGISAFRNNTISSLVICYTRFVNTMKFDAAMDVLLPCQMDKETPLKTTVETLFEPDPDTILDMLVPMMLHDVAYADVLESTTSEQGSRRMAMKTASDNATDLAEDLLLVYNKARQAAITQEITEIVSGSQAV